MSTRKIKDAKDLSTNELIYFRNHAKATFMSDGRTVEDAIKSLPGGTITEIYMNGELVGNSGVIDLGTVLTKHQSLEGYATEEFVTSQGYLTEHQDISSKQDVLVSGDSIKTINGISVLGSGNIYIDSVPASQFNDLLTRFEQLLTAHDELTTKYNELYTKHNEFEELVNKVFGEIIDTWPPENNPDDIIATGEAGDGITWTLTGDGTLTIRGEGIVTASSTDSPAGYSYYEYKDLIKTINVYNAKISGIDVYAFSGYPNLTSINFLDE